MEYKEGMTFKEFVASKRKREEGKLNADFKVKDYLAYYKHTVWRYQGGLTKAGTRRKRMQKNGKWNLTPVLYKKILSSINSLLLEAVIQGEDIELPVGFGIIYARQKDVYTKLNEDGTLKTNRAINWKETLQLWYDDKEARETKQIVYQDNSKVKAYIRIKFGDFINKRFLKYCPTIPFMRKVAKGIKDGSIVLPEKGTSTKAIKDIQI